MMDSFTSLKYSLVDFGARFAPLLTLISRPSATQVLNTASPDGNSKYADFNNVAFDRIKVCMDAAGSNCVEHAFGTTYSSATALFSAGYLRDESVDQAGFLSAFGAVPGTYADCPMQRPGFNIQCNDGNKARWGWCGNCANQGCQIADNNDADYALGIGLAGQSTTEMGAGWTNYFASGAGTWQ